jgi:hypothetical protein
MQATHFESGGRYPVLRSIGILALFGAFLALIGGMLAAGWALFAAPETLGTRMIYALIALSGTFFTVVSILAAAEVIKLVLDIERNTRAMMYGTRSMPAVTPPAPVTDSLPTDGMAKPGGRLQWIEGEETAEGALLRGH